VPVACKDAGLAAPASCFANQKTIFGLNGISMLTTDHENGLDARGLAKSFGALSVLKDVDFSMGLDQAVGIVGPNGAGKTTLLAIFSGAYPPNAGIIRFAGKDVSHLGAADRCRLGLVRTHQIPKPFSGMTTFENIFVAATHGSNANRDEAYDRTIDSLKLCGMLRVANRRQKHLAFLIENGWNSRVPWPRSQSSCCWMKSAVD